MPETDNQTSTPVDRLLNLMDIEPTHRSDLPALVRPEWDHLRNILARLATQGYPGAENIVIVRHAMVHGWLNKIPGIKQADVMMVDARSHYSIERSRNVFSLVTAKVIDRTVGYPVERLHPVNSDTTRTVYILPELGNILGTEVWTQPGGRDFKAYGVHGIWRNDLRGAAGLIPDDSILERLSSLAG